MSLISAALAAKIAAVATTGTIAWAGYAALKPPPVDPVKRLQHEQQLYAKDRRSRLQMQRGEMGRAIDAEIARRSVPSLHAPAPPRIIRLLRLIR